MQCFFTVVYHLGLRLNEALHLQICDIDSKRIHCQLHASITPVLAAISPTKRRII
jgi:integrase